MEDKKMDAKIILKKIKRKAIGLRFTDGVLFKIIVYALLVVIGFVFLYPIIFILSNSFKDINDLFDPSVAYLPTHFYPDNYRTVWETINMLEIFFGSLLVTLVPAIIQTVIASFIGYGFARFNFPGKGLIFALVVLTYVIPTQVTMIPRYVLFNQMKWLETSLSVIIPATFGQGLYSAIFILIFYNFYKMIPKVLDEAAEIDGASKLYIYFKISVPLSIPSFVTAFLFSFVWYWNETYLASFFFGTDGPKTLLTEYSNFAIRYEALYKEPVNDGISSAATMIIIAPMLIIYAFLQKRFIEGIDKAGITGE